MLTQRKRFEPKQIPTVVKDIEPLGLFDDLKVRRDRSRQMEAVDPTPASCLHCALNSTCVDAFKGLVCTAPAGPAGPRVHRPARRPTGNIVQTMDGSCICIECGERDTCALKDSRRRRCALFQKEKDCL